MVPRAPDRHDTRTKLMVALQVLRIDRGQSVEHLIVSRDQMGRVVIVLRTIVDENLHNARC